MPDKLIYETVAHTCVSYLNETIAFARMHGDLMLALEKCETVQDLRLFSSAIEKTLLLPDEISDN